MVFHTTGKHTKIQLVFFCPRNFLILSRGDRFRRCFLGEHTTAIHENGKNQELKKAYERPGNGKNQETIQHLRFPLRFFNFRGFWGIMGIIAHMCETGPSCLRSEWRKRRYTPWRLTAGTLSSWRFGRSFSFPNGWFVDFVGSILIFQGVSLLRFPIALQSFGISWPGTEWIKHRRFWRKTR